MLDTWIHSEAAIKQAGGHPPSLGERLSEIRTALAHCIGSHDVGTMEGTETMREKMDKMAMEAGHPLPPTLRVEGKGGRRNRQKIEDRRQKIFDRR